MARLPNRLIAALLLLTWCSAWCSTWCSTVNGVAADEPLISGAPWPSERLVQQLGNPSFSQREAAFRELSALGLAAKQALLKGLQASDPEIRWRCAQLWDAVSVVDFEQRAEVFLGSADENEDGDFPGWWRYRTRLGSSRSARSLFVEMQRAEPLVWAQLDNEMASSRGLFMMLEGGLRGRLAKYSDRQTIALGSVSTLWFMAGEDRLVLTAEESATMRELGELPRLQDALRDNAPLQVLWLAGRRGTIDERPVLERLMSCLRDGLSDEAHAIARPMLLDPGTPAESRQYALLALVGSDDPNDDVLIGRFLMDTSPLGTHFSRGIVLQSELRDVALATLIKRAGQDPQDFGFRYLRVDAAVHYSPSTLGFPDSAEREATFSKWSAEVNLW